MYKLRQLVSLAALLLGLLAAACSPEADRTRGGKGADVGNRPEDPSAVDIHGKLDPGYRVPAVGRGIEGQRK